MTWLLGLLAQEWVTIAVIVWGIVAATSSFFLLRAAVGRVPRTCLVLVVLLCLLWPFALPTFLGLELGRAARLGWFWFQMRRRP